MPLVSVIMPVYNCEAFVREAVDSVLKQTEPDLELIVVNDGSTDGTLAILDAMASSDHRLQIHTQANSGKPSIARDAGIRRSIGEYVAFIDGDDTYHPRRLERGLEALARVPDATLAFSDLIMYGNEAEKEGAGHLTKFGLRKLAKDHMSAVDSGIYACHPSFYECMSTSCFGAVITLTVLVRRSALAEEVEWFPESLTTYEDNDLWLRLAVRSRFAYVDEVLAYYRRHASNITSDAEKMARGAIEARVRNLERGRLRLSKKSIRHCRKAISYHLLRLGYCLARSGERAAARKYVLQSLEFHPSLRVIPAYLKTFTSARFL